MKVLFAVNNDNVSEAIATKYQKEYKEILSYKNVYYFNAIIRELQKDKSYNRVVISEDLEPFANNNYDMIDKFLLNKYSSISQEAKTFNEERIEIILLGADRRKKSEDMLIRLFGLEIYNVILGQDRSIEEVCRLIYSPREKNEARGYYNIPVNELSGQEEGDNHVSEAEVENILAHYKRLGRNEEKYVDSFNNIISQYTDMQLKIIIKYLPIHVKAVLEEKSPKYQQLVTSGLNAGNTNFEFKSNKYKQKPAKKGFMRKNREEYDNEANDFSNNDEFEEAIIDRDFMRPKMTKPIVIPSDMNANNVQRVVEPRTMGNQEQSYNGGQNNNLRQEPPYNGGQNNNLRQEQQYEGGQNNNLRQEPPYNGGQNNNLRQEQQYEGGQNNNLRQEPPASSIDDISIGERPEIPQVEPKPVMKPEIENKSEIQQKQVDKEIQENKVVENPFSEVQTITDHVGATPNKEETEPQPVKRGRGRPRTKPIVEVDPNKPKRGRGRPRKEVPKLENQESITQAPVETSTIEEVKPINQEQESNLFDISEEIEQNATIEKSSNEQNTGLDLFNMDLVPETSQINNETEPMNHVNSDASNNILETSEVDLFNIEDEVTPIQQTNNTNDFYSNTENYTDFNQSYTMQNNHVNSSIEEADLFNMGTAKENDFAPDLAIDMNVEEERQAPYKEEQMTYNGSNENTEVDLFDIEGNEEENDIMTTDRVKTISNLNNLLTSDKKIVAFVGTTKNGTSFIVNNTAEMLASMGISTAILDMTKSKNSYYIYTNNEEELRSIATKCMKNLEKGIAEGVKINRSLTIYTEMPGEEGKYNIDSVLATLIQNYSAILIDTDFETPIEIFERVQEIYLVQTLDVLTIQPLTAFLRNLKSKNILQQEKLKIVINKAQKMRSLNIRTLIGGMSCYNAPNMSYMTELFDKDNVKYCEIPFETQNYIKYLESLVNCSITLNGYTKSLLASLRELANIVYPLVSKQGYSTMNGNRKDPFSKQMSSTLNKMRNKGY